MTSPTVRVENADTEAAAWHARLGEKAVSKDTIKDFFAWRQTPANAEAYQRVEKIWADTGKLTADPQVQEALGEAMSRRSEAPRPRRLPRTLMGLGAIGAALVLAFAVQSWLETRSLFATDVGQQHVVQLNDGSSVRLDTGSRIRVRFNRTQRVVDLEQGQALFTVARDADRPFVVQAGLTRVTAVGTVFDVRRDAASVKVILVSGVVDVAPVGEGRPSRRMAAGQQARVTPDAAVTGPVDVAAATGWTTGRIVFRGTPLREAVEEVNRYLTDPIALEAAAGEGQTVNGVFRTGDRDAFVSAAAAVFDLQVSQGPDGAVHLSAEK